MLVEESPFKHGTCNGTTFKFGSIVKTKPHLAIWLTSIYFRGSQTGVHVPLVVHLLMWRGTFNVNNRRENFLYIIQFKLFTHMNLSELFMLLTGLNKEEYWVHTCWLYFWLFISWTKQH